MIVENENFITDKLSIDQLIKRSWDYRSSEDFIKFVNFIASMDHYSRFTSLLVKAQNKAVTFFGGVSYWKKKFKRTINNDAHPLVILVPNGPVMMVYDIFDTAGENTPEEFLEKGLGRKPLEVKGAIDPKKLNFAVQVAKDFGIKILFKPLSYFKAGYIDLDPKKLEICLKEGMTPEQNLSFLIHELAHLFLGHTGHKELAYRFDTKKNIRINQRDLSKTAMELEAETIRYLICHKLGLETRSAEYIGGYIKSANDLLEFSYENVVKTADKIEKIFIN